MSPSPVLEFTPSACRLRLGPLLRAHGYRDLSAVLPPIRRSAEQMLDEARGLIAPRVVYTRRGISRLTPTSLVIDDGTIFTGRCFRNHLGEAEAVVAFIVTLGSALDARVDTLWARGDMLEALFLETLGTLAVQETTRGFRLHLAAAVRPVHDVTSRLGPGYHDWPVAEQSRLFALFPAPLPVTLTEAAMMVPLKSLSGLYGLRRVTNSR